MKRRSRLAPVLLVLLVLVAMPPVASAQTPTATFVEPHEYGTDERHDPLDYSQSTDLMTDPDVTVGVRYPDAQHPGTVTFDAPGNGFEDWYVSPVWMTFPHHVNPGAQDLPDADGGALHDQHDGLALPIDADRDTHLSMRFFVDGDPEQVFLDWFTCQEWLTPCRGRMVIPDLEPNSWNTVDLAIQNNVPSDGLPQEWRGTIHGLRLAGNTPNGNPTFTLDWFRLYDGGSQFDMTVASSSTDGQISYSTRQVLDADQSADAAQTWGYLRGEYVSEGVMRVNVGALPPGTWYLHDDGIPKAQVSIAPRPRPEILDPDMAGGPDYATEVLGNPWDFEDPSDAVAIRNATGVRWSDGELSAVNTSNDPYVELPLGPDGLDPVHYHRVTIDQHYDSEFNLDDAARATNPRPGGSHGRLIWRTPQHEQPALCRPQGFSDGREFVFYKTWETYTYDMKNVPAAQGMTSSAEPNLGLPLEDECGGQRDFPADPHWTAKGALTYLRLDPHESPTQYRWYIDDLRIAADDTADPTFDITWTDHQMIDGTRVVVKLDDNRSGYDGEVVYDGPQRQRTMSVTFDATERRPGAYWVNITATAPSVDGEPRVSRDYATGPLQVSPRISGRDRVATAVEVSRQSFDAARTAIVASSEKFPDALVAVQLADAVQGPVLLTPAGGLDDRVAAELDRLGVREAIVVGGTAAIGERARRQLDSTVDRVTRIGGATRYETASNIAREALQRRGQSGADRVLVATGENFPDALAAGPYVGHSDTPLVLARPAQQAPPGPDGEVPPPTVPSDNEAPRDFLADVGADGITVLGGEVALTDQVVDHVADGRPTDRIRGADRFATARKLTQGAVDAGGSASDVLVATGRNYPDALSAGPAALARGGVLVLTEKHGVPATTADWLRDVDQWSSWRVVGGSAAVSHATVRALRSASGL